MIATVTNPFGEIVFIGCCPLAENSFTDAEKKTFARLMGEVDTFMMGVLRRRATERADNPVNLSVVEPATAADLRRLGKNGHA